MARHIQFDGRPALLAMIRDLTVRKTAEAAVRESEQRFRSLFEQAPIGIVLVDADTRFIRVNQARTHPDARPGPYVRLSVSDTGTGIDPPALPRIFEPFFATKDQGEGVGRGLAMVHGAVKQSGGFVTVQSEPRHGATFELYLPVHAEAAGIHDTAVEHSTAS